MSAGHSVLAPSSMARTVQCAASVSLEQRYPETGDRTDALEGEASHWAAAEMLQGRLVEIGQRAPNGIVLTQEMVEGADLYYDDVVRRLKPHGLSTTDCAVEVPVACPAIHADCWGTPDCRVWVPGNRPTLIVWDYKFGHRVVEVIENWQLMTYVSGCISATRLSDLDVDVEVRIVQPRAFHRDGPVRSWSFRASDIRAHINTAAMAADAALRPNPVARVGPECRDCRARHACTALQQAAQDACDVASTAQPFDLPPAALGTELRMLKRAQALLEARVSGLEEQALAQIKQGRQVAHWTVEHGLGRQRWAKPDAEVITLGQLMGLNIAKPPEPVTPKQAVKLGLPEALLAEYAETPRGAAALVPDTGSKARAIFGRNST